MQNLITRARTIHHQTIRRQQLDRKFSQNRRHFETVAPSQCREMLDGSIDVLSEEILNEDDSPALVNSLINISTASAKYNIINFFIKMVKLDVRAQRVRSGQLPEECSLFRLILIMIKQQRGEAVLDECAMILTNFARQLRYQRTLQLQLPIIYQNHYSLMLQEYPFQLLRGGLSKVVISSLSLLYELVVSCPNGQALHFFINKSNPNILKTLIKMQQNELLMNIEQVRSQFVSTVSTILFYMNQYGYAEQHNDKYQFLLNLIKEMIINNLNESQQPDQFKKQCQLMKVIVKLQRCEVKEVQVQLIQQKMERELQHWHQPYIQLINALMYKQQHQLTMNSIRLLMINLFNRENQDKDKDIDSQLKWKTSIISIIKNHMINCGNKFLSEEREILFGQWGQEGYAYNLINLMAFLNGRDDTAFNNMIEILSLLLISVEQQDGLCLLQTKLYPLIEYSQFKTMLLDINYDFIETSL